MNPLMKQSTVTQLAGITVLFFLGFLLNAASVIAAPSDSGNTASSGLDCSAVGSELKIPSTGGYPFIKPDSGDSVADIVNRFKTYAEHSEQRYDQCVLLKTYKDRYEDAGVPLPEQALVDILAFVTLKGLDFKVADKKKDYKADGNPVGSGYAANNKDKRRVIPPPTRDARM